MTKLSLPQRPKILVIRRDNIGDLVCTTPGISAIRKHYPEAEIAALVNSYNSEVLRGNPNLDHIFVYQKLKHAAGIVSRLRSVVDRLKVIILLRRWSPDVAILAKANYDLHGLKFARHIGVKNVIGYVPDFRVGEKRLPDIQLPAPQFTEFHEVEAVNKLLEPLGITDALGPLEVFPDGLTVASLVARLPRARRFIALHISAREPERKWGNGNFIALCKRILEANPDIWIMLFWSPGKANDVYHPGDDEAAAQIVRAVESDRLVAMPTENLTQLVAALSLCELFIGTDGGAMHLCVGLNLPMVCLFERNPSKLNHWYPWKVPSLVVCGENPEVSSINLEVVESAVNAMLKRAAA